MRQALTIVFNGAHTIEACIEQAIPVLDRMVVVEGAVEWLGPLADNGRSTDGTNEILDRLTVKHPEKLIIIRKGNCCWSDKLEMCNAAVPFLKPGLLWQIDCDEFYFRADMEWMMDYMEKAPRLTEAEFWAYHFYGGLEQHTPLAVGAWGNDPPWRRLFRYGGEKWLSHEPPRLDRSSELVVERGLSRAWGIYLYHYGFCWPKQVWEKTIFQHHRWKSFDPKQAVPAIPPRGDLVRFRGEHPVALKCT